MSDIDELIKNVFDFFQKRFGGDKEHVGPGDLFLAFERVGLSVSRNDYKLQPQDSAFNKGLMLERGSDLVNHVPQLDSEGFIEPYGDLSPKADDEYQNLVSLSTYMSRTPDDAGLDAFLRLKGQAQR